MESNTCGYVQYSVFSFWPFMDIDTTTWRSAVCLCYCYQNLLLFWDNFHPVSIKDILVCLAICKPRDLNLGIGIGIGIGIGTDTTNAITSSSISPMDTKPSRVVI